MSTLQWYLSVIFGICATGSVFSYKLRYIAGFGLVEMTISTNPNPTIYCNLYDNNGTVVFQSEISLKPVAQMFFVILILKFQLMFSPLKLGIAVAIETQLHGG